MNITIPKPYWRIFLMVFFEVIFCFLLYQAFIIILHSDTPHPWLVGDWLINYQGGIVRRGLTGEFVFQLAKLSGNNIVILIVVFQTFLYLVFLINSYRLSSKSPFSPFTAMLICSPAFILFPVLDPIGAFRKEILFFALLSTLCVRLIISQKGQVSKRAFIYMGVAAVFIALSHEMLIVYFPYLIAALIIYDGGLSNQTKKGFLALTPAIGIAFLIMIFNRGDNQTVINICNSLKPHPPLDCISPGVEPGAITFLGENLASAHEFVLESLNPNTIFAYTITTILALIPVVSTYFSRFAPTIKGNAGLKFWLALCVLSAMAGSIPLFWVVADFGRLVYIHVTCLTLLILMGIQEKDDKPLLLTIRQIPVWILVFLFAISWRLIHWRASLEGAFPILATFELLFKL